MGEVSVIFAPDDKLEFAAWLRHEYASFVLDDDSSAISGATEHGRDFDIVGGRTIMKTAALLVLALIAGPLSAEVGWKDENGNPLPETQSQKSVAGFGGSLIVTPDKDWEKKWNSPDTPQFSSASTVEKGGELFILTIFTNPKLDASGVANITLDIDVRRPDGSTSTHAEGAVCLQGELRGPLYNVYLCGPVLEFIGEPADPVGEWSVRIKLIDNIRKVEVPLSTTFTLVNDETKR